MHSTQLIRPFSLDVCPVRETMKKNKLEEEEAEEEMDELHHENEELHQQLDKLQKENSEIKAKLASVADDSEKLGGLKVRNVVVYARVCLSILLILHPTYTDGAANARGGKTTGEVGSGIGRRQND